jgi:hypothetical protein
MAQLAVLFGARLDPERAQAIGRQLYDVLDGESPRRSYHPENRPAQNEKWLGHTTDRRVNHNN